MTSERLVHDVKLQDAATTGNGVAVDFQGMNQELAAYIEGSAGVTAGAVQIETAHATDYTGTWAPLGSPITVVASTVSIVQVSGVLKAFRSRISTTVAGGTVSVRLFAN